MSCIELLYSYFFLDIFSHKKSRGNDILGINDCQIAEDNLPYSTISYANGPGHKLNINNHGRKNLRQTNMHDIVS